MGIALANFAHTKIGLHHIVNIKHRQMSFLKSN